MTAQHFMSRAAFWYRLYQRVMWCLLAQAVSLCEAVPSGHYVVLSGACQSAHQAVLSVARLVGTSHGALVRHAVPPGEHRFCASCGAFWCMPVGTSSSASWHMLLLCITWCFMVPASRRVMRCLRVHARLACHAVPSGTHWVRASHGTFWHAPSWCVRQCLLAHGELVPHTVLSGACQLACQAVPSIARLPSVSRGAFEHMLGWCVMWYLLALGVSCNAFCHKPESVHHACSS